MRAALLQTITTAISTLTQFGVSTELPWSQNNLPLYLKNLKKVYVDRERNEEDVLIPLLNADDIYEDTVVAEVYVAVDAKNPPSQLDNLITKILGAKTGLGSQYYGPESDYSQEKQEDVLIYTFEFRANTLTT